MSWDVAIVKDPKDERVVLGTREDEIRAFANCTPSIELFKPDVPPPEMLAMMPEIIRQSALRGDLEAIFETDDVDLHFQCSDEPEIRFVCVEARGDGNPLPILAALCLPNGWHVVEACNGPVVDLNAESAPGWEKFQRLCDAAFGEDEDD